MKKLINKIKEFLQSSGSTVCKRKDCNIVRQKTELKNIEYRFYCHTCQQPTGIGMPKSILNIPPPPDKK